MASRKKPTNFKALQPKVDEQYVEELLSAAAASPLAEQVRAQLSKELGREVSMLEALLAACKSHLGET